MASAPLLYWLATRAQLPLLSKTMLKILMFVLAGVGHSLYVMLQTHIIGLGAMQAAADRPGNLARRLHQIRTQIRRGARLRALVLQARAWQ